jgi:hypothetical protein
MAPGWLRRWGLTPEELDEILEENPSLRGITVGYLAEYKLRKMLLSDERITALHKYDDHDRRKKHDIAFSYKGCEITVEAKSLQTKTAKSLGDDRWKGAFQCDASDKRMVTFPDGSTMGTTCLLYGGFDIIAANLFAFGEIWRWGFAKNSDLPPSKFKKYTGYQRQHLIATMVQITWPLLPPFEPEPFRLFEEISQRQPSQKQ